MFWIVCILIFTLLTIFIWKRKNLTLFEGLAIFLLSSTINQNILNIVTVNMKLIRIPKEVNEFFEAFVYRTLVIPLLVVIFLDIYTHSKTMTGKIIVIVFWIILLTSFEYIVEHLSIFHFIRWNIWYSLMEWLFVIIASLLCHRFLYYLHTKGSR
ncbi:hypothetical protein P4482_13455 [Neobacillus thermocopriae]|nr:hypothetical protein [Neobacillus thermocopriae]MED3715191.1 hypothetical protein [Neobacillus thermocopriae]